MNPVVITCATGLESLLIEEIQSLGANECEKQSGAVRCLINLETAYKICLWSRIASRVLWQIKEVSVIDVEELYDEAIAISWDRYFSPDKSFRINLDLVKNDDKYSVLPQSLEPYPRSSALLIHLCYM